MLCVTGHSNIPLPFAAGQYQAIEAPAPTPTPTPKFLLLLKKGQTYGRQ